MPTEDQNEILAIQGQMDDMRKEKRDPIATSTLIGSIEERKRDFTRDMKPCNIRIKGVTGGYMVKWKVTWTFGIEYNDSINKP